MDVNDVWFKNNFKFLFVNVSVNKEIDQVTSYQIVFYQ